MSAIFIGSKLVEVVLKEFSKVPNCWAVSSLPSQQMQSQPKYSANPFSIEEEQSPNWFNPTLTEASPPLQIIP